MRAATKLLLVALLLALGGSRAAAQSGHDLFQQALVMERSNGQIREAIELYQRIASEYATDRALAARALVQLGRAHEKLGSAEATKAYQRVVRDYADQEPEVAEARAYLAALQSGQPVSASAEPATRLISDGLPDAYRMPTRDGRHLLDYDDTERAFTLVDIQSGNERQLTTDGPQLTTEGLQTGAFVSYDLSPDGRTVAGVLVHTPPGGNPFVQIDSSELRLFDVGGRGSGRSVYRWGPGTRLALFGWTPEENRIWMMAVPPDRTAQIASVGLADGSLQVLKTLSWRSHTQPPSLSPDGRFVTYHHASDQRSPSDIFILATDGSGEFRVEHPAPDSKPIFTPDGSGIVFESDRRGARDLWFLPVADGRPAGEPRVAWRHLGYFGQVYRFAENGNLFYYFGTNDPAVYTARIDGEVDPVDVEKLIPRNRLMNSAPAWSPDGRFLAHLRGSRRIVVRDLTSGTDREFSFAAGPRYAFIDWCDTESLLITRYQRGTGFVTYRLDVQNGEQENLELATPVVALCAATTDALIYNRGVRGGTDSLVRRSLSSSENSVLFVGPSNGLARSPDGRHISFVVKDSNTARLMVMPSTGGEPRELMTAANHQTATGSDALLINAAWMPDGRNLLVLRGPQDVPEMHSDTEGEVPLELWRVPFDGGAARKLGRLPDEFNHSLDVSNFRVHPDGSRIVLDRRELIAQMWSMENLLQQIHAGVSQ